MKVDYHLHLEEGPYSSNWLKRTADAITNLTDLPFERHTREWVEEVNRLLHSRIEQGSFSNEWLDLYVKQAKQKGLKEVGIVDHLYRFKEYRSYYDKHIYMADDELGNLQRSWLDKVCVESIESFIQVIEEAKPKWEKEGIKLRLGMEADYYLNGEAELADILSQQAYDYIIGSVHFIDGWGFDNPETQERFKEHDLIELYRTFFGVVERSISSGLFDYVAHLDNLKVFSYRPDEAELLPFYHQIAKRLKETGTVTEINAGLHYRYPIKEMCPSPTFLNVLVEHGVDLTISSDAHFPDDLGNYADRQLAVLKDLGVKEVTTFEQRKKMKQPI